MRKRLVLGLCVVFCPTLFAFACSLDLDESLIGKKDSGAIIGDVNVPEGAIVTESGVVEDPTAAPCTRDDECVSANGCLKGRCDLARRACAFEVCRSAVCTAGKCNEATRVCSDPVPYKLQAASFQVAAPFASINGIAAAYPWVFAATQAGVYAYNVSNPGNATPAQVPVVGIGFVPIRMVRSGNRIWFMTNASGPPQGPLRLPVAYIDVPGDPFATTLRATNVVVEWKRPAEQPRYFAREGKSLLVVGPGPSFASSIIEPTIAEPASLTPTTFGPPENTEAFAVSGTRLVMMTTNAGIPSVNLSTNVGGGTVTNERAVALADIGAASLRRDFGWASTVDGTVFWAGAANVASALPPGGALRTGSTKGFFLLADGKAPLPDAPKGIDLEVYLDNGTLGADADVVRFPVLVDNDTALVPTSSKDDLTKVAVNVVKRDPLATVPDRRTILNIPIASVLGSSASNGIAYFATNETIGADAAAPPIGKVYVIDPACAP